MLKNTSWYKNHKPVPSLKAKGRSAEDKAAEHLTATGHLVLFRNARFLFSEADLISLAPDGSIWMIEVKRFCFVDGGLTAPVGKEQAKRLSRLFDHLSHSSPRTVRAVLITVNESEIQVFMDYLQETP